jgi:hypothetical protein
LISFHLSVLSVKLKRFDMYAKLDKEDEARQRMISKLRAAAVDAAIESRDEESESLQQISLLSADMIGDSLGMPTKRLDEVEKLDFDRFKLTLEVTKWLQGAGRGNDAKLRKIFQQRMRQLAAGDKSRILQKKLVGSKNMTIYETYMDGNFRILWTKDSDLGMVIWYVAQLPHLWCRILWLTCLPILFQVCFASRQCLAEHGKDRRGCCSK